MKRKHLKRGLFTSPQSGNLEFERYVIENVKDLNKFLRVFDVKLSMVVPKLKEALSEGEIIIATDEHPLSGMFTYCYETKDKTNIHPSTFHRVKLLN